MQSAPRDHVDDGAVIRIEPSPTTTRDVDETPAYVLAGNLPEPQLAGEEQFRFGEWLLRRELITRVDLFNALCLARKHHCRLGDALVELGLVWRTTIEREARAFKTFSSWIRHGRPLTAPR